MKKIFDILEKVTTIYVAVLMYKDLKTPGGLLGLRGLRGPNPIQDSCIAAGGTYYGDRPYSCTLQNGQEVPWTSTGASGAASTPVVPGPVMPPVALDDNTVLAAAIQAGYIRQSCYAVQQPYTKLAVQACSYLGYYSGRWQPLSASNAVLYARYLQQAGALANVSTAGVTHVTSNQPVYYRNPDGSVSAIA